MKSLFRKNVLAMLLALVMALSLAACGGSGGSGGSAYPTKGIAVICPWAAGGGTDSCLRAYCEAVGTQLGVTLTVDNQTGGSGITGHQNISNAAADGYTIGMITFELSTYGPQGTDISYESYDLLCLVNTDPAGITVNAQWAADNNITDLQSFIDYCKAHPGEVQMGGSSSASVWHIAGGVLEAAAGIDIEMITYADGAATAVQNAASGFIQGVTVSLAEARSFIQSGDLICLGFMSNERNPAFPDVPTCAEQGYDITYGTWRGMAAPKGLDADVLQTLRDACEKAVSDETFVAKMAELGQEISYMNATDFGAFLAQNAVDVEEAMNNLGLGQ